MSAEEPEFCVLCADCETGAPRPPTAGPSDRPDLEWVGCHKCTKWVHSVCAVSGSWVADLPAELREEMEASGEGVWFDWPARVDKWFCTPCIEFSISSDNPRRPKKPLATTLKKKPARRRGSQVKRTRLSSSAAVEAALPVDSPAPVPAPAADPPAAAPSGRPRRQAALDRPDYLSMHNHVATPTKQWVELIKDPAKFGRIIGADDFPRVPGSLLTREWVESGRRSGKWSAEFPQEFPPTLFYGPAREPLVVHPDNGGLGAMGGVVPGPELTVDDVADLVGPDKMVDVIDVATQTSAQWPLSRWAEYVRARANGASGKVYNIISLEISGTELAAQVRPPRLVSEIDWVENFWPFPAGKEATMRAAASAAGEDVKGKGRKNEWPKVQLYCLMGMKDSWTDWHVDFAASSVYYSVHTGRKVFFFVRPTEANLAAYAQWSGSDELQASTWLPDMCDGVRKVTLEAGDTMIIPAGYIHAVFTPVDSIVFGGNFVHSYDIPTQLRLRQIEIDTKVPQRFRFPFFDRLCWHVARRSTADLRALREYRPTKENSGSLPPDRVLRGLVALARFLIAETERMESPATEDKIRKLVYGRIPPEVADPAALAHELLWRAERELPAGWEEEEAEVRIDTKGAKGKKRKNGATTPASAATTKRARAELPAAAAAVAASVHDCAQVQWESEEHKPVCEAENVMLPRPVNREGDEYAKQVTTTHRQTRRRVREEEDSGGPVLILEEHELVFTERQVTWLLPDSS